MSDAEIFKTLLEFDEELKQEWIYSIVLNKSRCLMEGYIDEVNQAEATQFVRKYENQLMFYFGVILECCIVPKNKETEHIFESFKESLEEYKMDINDYYSVSKHYYIHPHIVTGIAR